MAHFEPFTTKQQALTTTAALISAANPNRANLLVINMSATIDVYVGDVNVSTSNGAPIFAGKGSSITVPTTGAVYGVAASGTPTIAVVEVQE